MAQVNAGALFPMYDRIEDQQRHKCGTCKGILYLTSDIPKFSIPIAGIPGTTPLFQLFDANTDTAVLSFDVSELNFTNSDDFTKFFVVFNGNIALDCGKYYYRLQIGRQVFYSEVFEIRNAESLECGHRLFATTECQYKNGIFYGNGYFENIYFENFEDYPTIRRSEVTATNGNQEVTVKSYRNAHRRVLTFPGVFDNSLLGFYALRDYDLIRLTNLETNELLNLTDYSFSHTADVSECLSVGTVSFERTGLIGSGCCDEEEQGLNFVNSTLPF